MRVRPERRVGRIEENLPSKALTAVQCASHHSRACSSTSLLRGTGGRLVTTPRMSSQLRGCHEFFSQRFDGFFHRGEHAGVAMTDTVGVTLLVAVASPGAFE